MGKCSWPNGTCQHFAEKESKPDHLGRVWMHCDEGLNYSKASMTRFVMFCLGNYIEIGSIHAYSPEFKGSHVSATVRIYPDMFEAFTDMTGGKLTEPPVVSLDGEWSNV